MRVLGEQGRVQAEPFADRGDGRRVRVGPGQRGRRVTGDEPQDGEDQERGPEQDEEGGGQPPSR